VGKGRGKGGEGFSVPGLSTDALHKYEYKYMVIKI